MSISSPCVGPAVLDSWTGQHHEHQLICGPNGVGQAGIMSISSPCVSAAAWDRLHEHQQPMCLPSSIGQASIMSISSPYAGYFDTSAPDRPAS